MNVPLTLQEWEASILKYAPNALFKWGEYQSAVRYAFLSGQTPFAFFDAFDARPKSTYYGGMFDHSDTKTPKQLCDDLPRSF